MAVPAFAAELSTIPQYGDWAISEKIQPRSIVNPGLYEFRLGVYDLYINVNNGNGTSASPGNRVILYSGVTTNDQIWRIDALANGYYVRTMLNPTLAMNYYHSSDNKCTLYSPENNYTNGKSDSLVNFNYDAINLVDWSGMRLNFSSATQNTGGVWAYIGNLWEINAR